MVHLFNAIVTATLLAVAALVQSAPVGENGLLLITDDVMERNVEMAVGRDGLDVLEEKLALKKREVINCKIKSPTNKTKWTAGEEVKVTWDPACVSEPKFANYTGTILLGHIDPKKPGYNLRIKHPLAEDFLLADGKKTFTLPDNLATRTKYFVVLMGDSGNKSPNFTIKSAKA